MDLAVSQEAKTKPAAVDYQTDPSRYKHWKLSFDGPVATLTMDIDLPPPSDSTTSQRPSRSCPSAPRTSQPCLTALVIGATSVE